MDLYVFFGIMIIIRIICQNQIREGIKSSNSDEIGQKKYGNQYFGGVCFSGGDMETNSFQETAFKLNISQSSLTKYIQKLESELGVSLLIVPCG